MAGLDPADGLSRSIDNKATPYTTERRCTLLVCDIVRVSPSGRFPLIFPLETTGWIAAKSGTSMRPHLMGVRVFDQTQIFSFGGRGGGRAKVRSEKSDVPTLYLYLYGGWIFVGRTLGLSWPYLSGRSCVRRILSKPTHGCVQYAPPKVVVWPCGPMLCLAISRLVRTFHCSALSYYCLSTANIERGTVYYCISI